MYSDVSLTQDLFTLTQSPIIYDGRHAGDELGTSVTHERAGHTLCPLVAAIALIGLLPTVGSWIPCVEHLHGGVSWQQGNLENNKGRAGDVCVRENRKVLNESGILEDWGKNNWSHRVHKENSVSRSVEDTVGILIPSELKAERVSDTSLQTHRMRKDHKPEERQPVVTQLLCVCDWKCVSVCLSHRPGSSRE